MAVNRRYTKQRELVLDALRSTHAHPTAEEIYMSLKDDHPEISLGTVYRNLNVLYEQGEIIRVEGNFPSVRFDGNAMLHYHFRCAACGELFDLELGYQDVIDTLANEISPHTINRHSIMFEGICRSCEQAN